MKPKYSKERSQKLGDELLKTVPVIRDLSLNPHCAHGPTILFERNNSRYFSCSAYRTRKLCPFFLTEEQWDNQDKLEKKMVIGEKCELSYPSSNSSLPTPTQRDKGEAQYHFTEDTVKFLVNLLKSIDITNVICIGTPSLHQFITKNSKRLGMTSFLLDFDERLVKQFPSSECALYNMCNHHFFQSEKKYKDFLKSSKSLGIITDPPFGAKVELVWNGGLEGVKRDFHSYHDGAAHCEILWIFPYFMEGHIINKCQGSDLKMSDYKVMYKNHPKFHEKTGSTGNGKASPVRIFTTIPLSSVKLPENLYRYCDECDKWVERRNLHCDICKVCPTKDGGETYIHCHKCQKCVKSTWIHCDQPCSKCHLKTAPCQDSNTRPSSISGKRNAIKKTTTFKKSKKKRRNRK